MPGPEAMAHPARSLTCVLGSADRRLESAVIPVQQMSNRPVAPSDSHRPLLLVDIDGVISLFGFDPRQPPDGTWQIVDGIAHLLSATAGEHLRALSAVYELAWCSGWEEKANDYLPHALGLPE